MDEIIQELTRRNKYSEWVAFGSYFGHIKDKNPYKYYDMNGNIQNVCSVSTNYRSNIINIPVFKQIYDKDPTHVKQATYKIVDKSMTLSTSGLATCCCLTISIGNKKFLAHLDSTINNKIPVLSDYESYYETLDIKLSTYDTKMTNHIYSVMKEEKCIHNESNNNESNSIKTIIYAGCLYSDLSVKKAKKICSLLGITDITIKHVDMFDKVSI